MAKTDDLKAEYSEPVNRSIAVCEMCYDTFGADCNCVECMKPTVSTVTVLDLCVGVNNDRANIEFDDGRLKNVSVNTLKMIRSGENG